MAIRDLLWACPLCNAVGGIARAGKAEACTACGAGFRRADRSRIEVRRADGRSEIRTATEWSALLPPEPPAPSPDPAGSGEGVPGEGEGSAPWRRDRVIARFAIGDEAIRHDGRFIGTMERFGPQRPGWLTLAADRIQLRLDEGETHSWALDDVAALQASSRTVQLRPRRHPIVSFAFPDSSARLWEESIAAALRRRWRTLGRGEIVEFQPRVVARAGGAPPPPPPPAPPPPPPPAPPPPEGGRPAAPPSPGERG